MERHKLLVDIRKADIKFPASLKSPNQVSAEEVEHVGMSNLAFEKKKNLLIQNITESILCYNLFRTYESHDLLLYGSTPISL